MARGWKTLIWIGILLAGLGIGTGGRAGSSIPWTEGSGSAFKAASASAMPVLVDVWAIWCAPCRVMEQIAHRDPEVVALAERFVPLKVDYDANEAFVQLYSAENLPTLLVLDDRRKELGRLTGLNGAPEMLGLMRRVLDGYPTYLELRDRTHEPEAALTLASYLIELGNGGRAAELLRRCRKSMKGASTGELSRVDLGLARAELADERPAVAIKLLERLSDGTGDDEIRAGALELLARAERERGRTAAADSALERLRAEFPEHASTQEVAPTTH